MCGPKCYEAADYIFLMTDSLSCQINTGRFINLIEKLLIYMPKENITWVYPEIERYYDEVIEAVKESRGILNFHDALIVHVANELKISHIVSFDRDFDKTRLIRIKDAEDI